MKSTLTYEMHNYAALSSPNISDSKRTKEIGDNRIEKYSLRQRQKRKHATTNIVEFPGEYSSSDNNDKELKQVSNSRPHKKAARNSNNSALTTISSNSVATATTAAGASSNSKTKSKAAPLSKYRRKTANARERTRMREINSAFENLRHCVPQSITGEDSNSTNEKLTKITTLRLAMKYISILSEALENPSFKADFLLQCKRDGDNRFVTNLDEDDFDDCAQISDDVVVQRDIHNFVKRNMEEVESLPKAKIIKSTLKSSGQRKGATTKRASKKRKLDASTTTTHSEIFCSATSESICSSISSMSTNGVSGGIVTSPTSSSIDGSNFSLASSPPQFSSSSSTSSLSSSSSYLFDNSLNSTVYANNINPPTISELSTLILESDGESLHLSEHCLSPLQVSYSSSSNHHQHHLLNSIDAACKTTTNHNDVAAELSNSIAMSLDNPLELSLRLLESSPLHFSEDQPPLSCISPLVTLDSFNPFGDLLPEHNSLDLFLT